MPRYLEPKPSPRGYDPITIEGRRRALSSRNLDVNRIPHFDVRVQGYRQVVLPGPDRPPLGPYTPVQEGLKDLVGRVEGENGDA